MLVAKKTHCALMKTFDVCSNHSSKPESRFENSHPPEAGTLRAYSNRYDPPDLTNVARSNSVLMRHRRSSLYIVSCATNI